jgi:hypothetical protein
MAGKRERSQSRAAQAKQQRAQDLAKAAVHATELKTPGITSAPAQALQNAAPRATSSNPHQPAADFSHDLDVTPWLRALGFTSQEARRGAELCADLGEATLEQRVRVALRGLAPHCEHRPAPVATNAT